MNMKWFKSLSLMLVLALVLAACGGGGSGGGGQASPGSNASGSSSSASSDGKVYEFDFNNFTASNGAIAKQVLEPWAQMVEQKSNGRVKINLYHGGALGASTAVLKDVRGGVYDMGLIFSVYYSDSELYPITIGDLPFALGDDIEQNTRVIKAFYERYKDKMLQGVVPMGIASAAPSYIFAKTPIRSVDDLKGKKMRATGAADVDIYRAWGATGVQVALEELYDSLAKGIIDGVITSAAQGRDTHLAEVAPYMTDVAFRVIQTIPIINEAAWNELPDDLKRLFEEELFQDLLDLIIKQNIEDTTKGKDDIRKMVEGKGEVFPMDPAELTRLKATVKVAWDKWAENAPKWGYNYDELLNAYKEDLAKEGMSLPF